MELQLQGKRQKTGQGIDVNSTTTYKVGKQPLQQNLYHNETVDAIETGRKGGGRKMEKLLPQKKSIFNEVEFDWEFFDLVNNILEYTNVVLNDLEIFTTPEIYSSILRNYYHILPSKAIDRLLNSIYKITIDKNHRISNGRYNAMFSKDFIKTFQNAFVLYCLNVTSTDTQMQLKYFNLLLKLIYHNILLVNDKTL